MSNMTEQKYFRIYAEAKQVTGTQSWLVAGSSKEEALKNIVGNKDLSVFENEEIEVGHLGDYYIGEEVSKSEFDKMKRNQ